MEDQKKGTAPRPSNFESEFPGLVEKPQPTEPSAQKSESISANPSLSADRMLFIISFLVPPVGFLVGAAYIARGDDATGRNHLWTAFGAMALLIIVLYGLSGSRPV